jgi:hypothetical protein
VDLLQFVALGIGLSRAAGALRRFKRSWARRHKAESVRTDRRVMVKHGAASQAASPTNANAGIDKAICTECGTGSERRLRQDYRTGRDGRAGADHYQRPDRRAFSDHGTGRNHGTRMYARLNIGAMSENMRDLRQTGARPVYKDHSLKLLMWELRTLWNKSNLRSAVAQDPNCIW